MRLLEEEEVYRTLTEEYHQRTELQHKALREALSKVPTAKIEKSPTEDPAAYQRGYMEGFMEGRIRRDLTEAKNGA